MAQDSQEKSLPATTQRLKKAREKGQVASSSDFVAGVVTVVVFLWLLVRGPNLLALVVRNLNVVTQAVGVPSHERDLAIVNGIFSGLLLELAGLLVAAGLAGMVANVAHKGGLVVSATPLVPDFSRLDFAEGFTRMFGMRQMTGLAIGFVSLILWFGFVVIIAWNFAPSLINAPLCGAACVLNVSTTAVWWLIVAGLIAIAVGGLLDLPLQISLFKRQMRMSHQERKQELKDTEGSPEVEHHRRLLQQTLMRAGNNVPTLILTSANTAVALRFHPDTTPIPMVVAKGENYNADRIIASAKRLGIPIWMDPELSRRLMEMVNIGMEIPPSEFGAVAPHIVKSSIAGIA